MRESGAERVERCASRVGRWEGEREELARRRLRRVVRGGLEATGAYFQIFFKSRNLGDL